MATFFKIGLFTFGGGYAMIPLIEREVVEKRCWISEKDLIDLIAISQSLPGIFAINLSTFIGQRQRGRSGAIASAIGCALPSFLVILALAAGLARFQELVVVQHFFIGVRAAVTAQILLATLKMGRQIVKDKVTAVIALAAWLLVIVIDLHPILTVLGGATAGMALYWLAPTYARRIIQPERKGGESS
ncbi:MAG: chromate transporter [Eubacteriales bacterium]|nr:chromate transporter [Eubacteriales bacterium]